MKRPIMWTESLKHGNVIGPVWEEARLAIETVCEDLGAAHGHLPARARALHLHAKVTNGRIVVPRGRVLDKGADAVLEAARVGIRDHRLQALNGLGQDHWLEHVLQRLVARMLVVHVLTRLALAIAWDGRRIKGVDWRVMLRLTERREDEDHVRGRRILRTPIEDRL